MEKPKNHPEVQCGNAWCMCHDFVRHGCCGDCAIYPTAEFTFLFQMKDGTTRKRIVLLDINPEFIEMPNLEEYVYERWSILDTSAEAEDVVLFSLQSWKWENVNAS